MSSLWLDLRIAVRMLRRAPSITVPAILVLAAGMGSATALYAVVYAMWLRPLPYPEPNRLVSVTTFFPSLKLDALASPDYGTWQGTHSLGPLAAYSIDRAALVAGLGDAMESGRARVSGNLLAVLNVTTVAGRGIQPADDRPGAPCVAVLSHALWRERFAADQLAMGRTVSLDGEPCTVIGVLPAGFRMPSDRSADLLTPLALDESWLRHGSGGAMKILRGVARLQPGATLDQARAELSARLAASRAQMPKFYGSDVSLRIVPLDEYIAGDVRTAALVLLAVVGSILLIASANIGGLLVARAAGRGREMAVRFALGASRIRIVRHLLVEGLVLGAAGVASGLVAAQVLIRLVERLRPAMLVRLEPVAISTQVLATALAAMLVCALLFSLAPALPLPHLRVRRVLVVAELALSLMLLAGAALLLESLMRLRTVAPGFLTERLVTASLSLKGSRYAERASELRDELRDRLHRTPGTIAVAFADALPPIDFGRLVTFSRGDRPLPEPYHRGDNVIVRLVDASFFQTMGIPLRQGRGFTPADLAGDRLVSVVNQALAERYFAGESAIGKQVDGLGLPWKTVIGITADTRNDGLRNAPRPEIYLPLSKGRKREGGGVTREFGLNVVIRTAADPAMAISMLRGHLRDMDRTLLASIRTMDEQWADLTAGLRFQAAVLCGVAVLALLMACAGVYGVLTQTVTIRRREMGIRMALGARPGDVQGLIVREAFVLAGCGAILGTAGTLGGTRLLASALYEVNPHDPLAIAGAAALLVALAVGASAAPARRASREDPAATLRAE
jgi:predicted permease